jgi:hypothetical protein
MVGDSLNHSPLTLVQPDGRFAADRCSEVNSSVRHVGKSAGYGVDPGGGASCQDIPSIPVICRRLSHDQHKSDHVHRNLAFGGLVKFGDASADFARCESHASVVAGTSLATTRAVGGRTRGIQRQPYRRVLVRPYTPLVQRVIEAVERLRLLCGVVEKQTDNRPARPLCYLAADAISRATGRRPRRIPPHSSFAWVATISTQAPSRAGGPLGKGPGLRFGSMRARRQ